MIKPIGHFRIHRELYNKPIWKQSTPEQKVVLMTLIAMAWFKPNEWEWKGEKFKTEPGQFVTSLQSISDDCGKGITIQNVRSSLIRFEKLGFLTNKSTKEGRLITIDNWGLYQHVDDDPTKVPTKTQQRVNKDPTTKEEGKKVKKEINKDIEFNFDIIYSLFNRKGGRQDALNSYIKLLEEHTHEQLLQSVKSFNRSDKSKGEYAYQANNFFGKKSYYKDFISTIKQTQDDDEPLIIERIEID
jgi:hypothetical protein